MSEAPFSDGMVARQDDTVATGHGCDTVTTILEGESTVLVEGKPVARRSSPLAPHTITNPAVPPIPPCIPHPKQIVNVGSETVLVGGLGIARFGDSADLGTVSSGARTVIAG